MAMTKDGAHIGTARTTMKTVKNRAGEQFGKDGTTIVDHPVLLKTLKTAPVMHHRNLKTARMKTVTNGHENRSTRKSRSLKTNWLS